MSHAGTQTELYLTEDTPYPLRFIPRHTDELALDIDDPLFVEEEEDDHWYRGYNMRTGERGVFPAYYAHQVVSHVREMLGKTF